MHQCKEIVYLGIDDLIFLNVYPLFYIFGIIYDRNELLYVLILLHNLKTHLILSILEIYVTYRYYPIDLFS